MTPLKEDSKRWLHGILILRPTRLHRRSSMKFVKHHLLDALPSRAMRVLSSEVDQVATTRFKLNYHHKETMVCTMDPQWGNVFEVPSQQKITYLPRQTC